MSFSTYFQSWVLGRARQYISSIMDRDIGLESDEELFSFLALLQHHGFPTPMLDWTKSPYIAAYFAFRDAPYVRRRGHKVAVYAFDYSMIVSYDGRIDCDKINFKEETVKYVEIVKPISAANPRLIPQQSICMLTNIDDIENWICKEEKGMPCDNDEGTYLIKFLLDSKEMKAVIRELNLMGINEMTMFPTVDGVCKYFSESMFSPSANYNI